MVMRRMRAEWIAFHLDALADELLEALRYRLIGGINLMASVLDSLSILSEPLKQTGVDKVRMWAFSRRSLASSKEPSERTPSAICPS
jgi:hypothetical protein